MVVSVLPLTFDLLNLKLSSKRPSGLARQR